MTTTPVALPFSAVVKHPTSELRFVSGQIAERTLLDRDAATQTDSICRTLATLLASHGKTLRDILRVGVFLTDMADYEAFNDAYRRHFEAPFPARTCVAVRALPFGARVEIDAVVA